MSLKINILAGWFAHLFTVLIGFFLMPYILGTVGEAQYGAWVFINAIAGYSGVIYGGFGTTICRYVSDLSARKEWDRLNQMVSSIQAVYCGTGLLAFLLTVCIAWWTGGLTKWQALSLSEIRVAILIVGATIGLGMIGSVYGGVLIGLQRLDIKRGIEIAVGLLRLVLTIICLQEQFGLITLALIFFATTFFEHLISAIYVYRLLPSSSIAPWKFNKSALQECFGFSAYNAVGLISEYLIYFTDTIIIGVVLGPLAVVPYQIGLRIAQMIQIPLTQVGEVILPRAGELHARHDHAGLADVVVRTMGLLFLISAGFMIGSAYFGELLITTWIGKSYPVSAWVMTLLVGAQVIAMPMDIARKALLGSGIVRFPSLIQLFEALINLVLSLLLIQWWGVLGVAWGTFIPILAIELFVFLPYAMRQMNIDSSMVWRSAIGMQIPALLALLLFCELGLAWTAGLVGWMPLLIVTFGGGVILIGTRLLTSLFFKRFLAASKLEQALVTDYAPSA